MIIAGTIWGQFLPIIRSLWTSSYVVVTCGISTLLLASFYLVFDVWGHLIWESKLLTDDGKGMPAEGWDGTFNGQLMPEGTYMWKASAIFVDDTIWQGSDNGKSGSKTFGTVSLIR